MDHQREPIVPGSIRLPATLTGEWSGRTWQGVVQAEEELVGIILLRSSSGFAWSRSRRSTGSGLPFRIAASPELAPDRDCWLLIDLGGGYLSVLLPGDPITHFAEMNNVFQATTGRAVWFDSGSESGEILHLGMLLMARSDVRFGRKHIWRLRHDLRETLSPQLRTMLVERRFQQNVL